MRCKFCNRIVGEARVRGKLDYVIFYTRNPNMGFFACIDCAKEMKASLSALDSPIRPCLHIPDEECYEPTSTRLRCQMLKQGWSGSPILCHVSLNNQEVGSK